MNSLLLFFLKTFLLNKGQERGDPLSLVFLIHLNSPIHAQVCVELSNFPYEGEHIVLVYGNEMTVINLGKKIKDTYSSDSFLSFGFFISFRDMTD